MPENSIGNNNLNQLSAEQIIQAMKNVRTPEDEARIKALLEELMKEAAKDESNINNFFKK